MKNIDACWILVVYLVDCRLLEHYPCEHYEHCYIEHILQVSRNILPRREAFEVWLFKICSSFNEHVINLILVGFVPPQLWQSVQRLSRRLVIQGDNKAFTITWRIAALCHCLKSLVFTHLVLFQFSLGFSCLMARFMAGNGGYFHKLRNLMLLSDKKSEVAPVWVL